MLNGVFYYSFKLGGYHSIHNDQTDQVKKEIDFNIRDLYRAYIQRHWDDFEKKIEELI